VALCRFILATTTRIPTRNCTLPRNPLWNPYTHRSYYVTAPEPHPCHTRCQLLSVRACSHRTLDDERAPASITQQRSRLLRAHFTQLVPRLHARRRADDERAPASITQHEGINMPSCWWMAVHVSRDVAKRAASMRLPSRAADDERDHARERCAAIQEPVCLRAIRKCFVVVSPWD